MHDFLKKNCWEFLPVVVLVFVLCFMLFIVEPVVLYAGNIDDLWFDFYDMIPKICFTFFSYLLLTLACLFALFLVCRKLDKLKIFQGLVLCLFCGFLAIYIQGNFLAGSLPSLNGDSFRWREYPFEAVVSCMIWEAIFIGMIVGLVVCTKRNKLSVANKVVGYVAGAIFLMLSASLVSLLLKPRVLANKDNAIATNQNIDLASSTENFFVFMVDAVDSRSFNEVLVSDGRYRERYDSLFRDFSYYPDTLSYYAYTRDSVPMIFSGSPNLNEKSFGEYSVENYQDAELFKELTDAGYKMNFFDYDLIMNKATSAMFGNVSSYDVKIDGESFRKQIIRYDLFKYLPWVLKGKAHIEKLHFSGVFLPDGQEAYSWLDTVNHKRFTTKSLELTDEKAFQFMHVEGAHIPLTLDEDFNIDEDLDWNRISDYFKKEKATFTLIESYINRIKEAGIYDNSVIVIMSDHGFSPSDIWEYDNIEERFNPILYVKGRNETHSRMKTSDKAVSYLDISTAFSKLLNGDKSTELFAEAPSGRRREMMWYVWGDEEHMVELETEGKAWETEKFRETGRVFDL